MKYVCLLYNAEEKLGTMVKGDRETLVSEILSCVEELKQQGHFIACQVLQSVRSATSVRVRGGRVTATEGPVIDADEQLAGFILIDARDLNEAIQVASRMPVARLGSIEVRPVRESDRNERWALP
ncbi:MAG TPA: YciI family protein [bacterium]|nr:YciI family protein [bacterium]